MILQLAFSSRNRQPIPGSGADRFSVSSTPRESPPKAHVDPDRSLLGALQDHLNAHGFSYGEIAQLTPDGEGGTKQQQRDRVKNRLQHRRRER
jgi:hypothetical protein